MRRVETSVVVNRPVEEVFNYLIEPSNMPEWAPGYIEGEWASDESIHAGSVQKRVTNFSGRQEESEHTVTKFEPNKRIALTSKAGPLEIVEIIEVERTSAGTKVLIAEEVTTPLLLKPAEWLFAIMAGRNVPKYGQALKDHLD